ncbi:MAG: hypothetical protein GX580_11555 [Candidatus Hydrogenedens sp.]|nr:hypothetical protein [Candidatus Hydrogenedentota bacterium]NLF58261.1 hypothetical protein [Candidatus Hydrogenedens sp.]
MKHVHAVTRQPQKAQDITIGQILTVVSQLLTVISAFWLEKEANQIQDL